MEVRTAACFRPATPAGFQWCDGSERRANIVKGLRPVNRREFLSSSAALALTPLLPVVAAPRSLHVNYSWPDFFPSRSCWPLHPDPRLPLSYLKATVNPGLKAMPPEGPAIDELTLSLFRIPWKTSATVSTATYHFQYQLMPAELGYPTLPHQVYATLNRSDITSKTVCTHIKVICQEPWAWNYLELNLSRTANTSGQPVMLSESVDPYYSFGTLRLVDFPMMFKGQYISRVR